MAAAPARARSYANLSVAKPHRKLRRTFEPWQLPYKRDDSPDCLTADQMGLVEKIYQSQVSPRTDQVIFPGLAKGTEASMANSDNGKPFPVALSMLYFAFQNPNWDWTTLNWDTDVNAAIAKIGPLMHVGADLKPSCAGGGKLLMYIGWNDGHNPEQQIEYFKSEMRYAGNTTRASARWFTIPSIEHRWGDEGCDTFNKRGVIDARVNQDWAPDRITASKVSDAQTVRTRCARPQVAEYKGTGDIDDGTNFICTRE